MTPEKRSLIVACLGIAIIIVWFYWPIFVHGEELGKDAAPTETCIGSEEFEKAVTAKIKLSNRQDFEGDDLAKLKARIEATDDIPNIPKDVDYATLFRTASRNYFIILYVKRCVKLSAAFPAALFGKVVEDGSI